MHDERAKEPQPQHERTPWIEPEIVRLNAGSAELLINTIDDGPVDYS
ncbi:MAG: hypothetical protein QOJ27_1544 [Sphingomonadales bacterium]|jgi:hypothetical protein|nr:hypothetical protein [Sphingomonadales bacterium]